MKKILIVLSVFLFASCQKEKTVEKKNSLLTKDEIKKIGTEHNRLLKDIINLSLKGIL